MVSGYTLPPLLRGLYTTVADGGFGPGYGLYRLFEVDRDFHPDDRLYGKAVYEWLVQALAL
jgi:hypothetical protein